MEKLQLSTTKGRHVAVAIINHLLASMREMVVFKMNMSIGGRLSKKRVYVEEVQPDILIIGPGYKHIIEMDDKNHFTKENPKNLENLIGFPKG